MNNRVYYVKTKKTTELLKEMFGEGQEALSKMKMHVVDSDWEFYKKKFPEGQIGAFAADQAGGNVMITIGWRGNPLIRFCVQNYPVCCGIRMLYNFSVNEAHATEEQIHQLLDCFFKENYYTTGDQLYNMNMPGSILLGTSRRLEVIMVEGRGMNDSERKAEAEIEPVDDPRIAYKSLWSFFHKHALVRTRLQYNENSGNILHNMEVIFPKP